MNKNCAIILLIVGIIQSVSAIFKCSPLDGALNTYSFTHGADNGVVCAHGSGQSDIVFFIDKLSPDGTRKLAVGNAKFSSADGFHRGFLYRLFPVGPKQPITLKSVPGYIEMSVNNGAGITWNLRPDGIAWTPADVTLIQGCAVENPQLTLNISLAAKNTSFKGLLCTMTADPGAGYGALYGFGLGPNDNNGIANPYFYLGETMSPIIPSAPINVSAALMQICMKSDCTQCRYKGFNTLQLNSQ